MERGTYYVGWEWDIGHRTMDMGHMTMDMGHMTMDMGHGMWDVVHRTKQDKISILALFYSPHIELIST